GGDSVSVTGSLIISSVVGFSIQYGASGGGNLGTGLVFAAGQGPSVGNVLGIPLGTPAVIYMGASVDTVNVQVAANSGYTLTVYGGAPDGGASGDTLNVTDISGGAMVFRTPLGPGSVLLSFVYAGGLTSQILYQDFEVVNTVP